MKERPILFSGAMVRAILSGAKTQTRRIVKPQPTKTSGTHRGYPLPLMANDWAWPHPRTSAATTISNRPNGPLGWEIHCPYGQPGDRLWVREAFMPCPLENPTTGPSRWNIAYASDAEQVERQAPAGYNPMLYNYERWTPSIHMPRWASRITLEIVSVRVERLKEIGAADAMEEGVAVHADHYNKPIGHPCSPVMAYRDLWEYINGPGSWDANPWVWVVGFRRRV